MLAEVLRSPRHYSSSGLCRMDGAGQRVSGPSVQTTPSPPPKASLHSQAWGN